MTKVTEVQTFFDSANRGHPAILTAPNPAGVVEGIAALQKAAAVTQIRARSASCDCPHCGAELDGWAVDPRGRETICDECKQAFSIAADAAVSIS